jgi:hypothetical protein
MIGSEKRRSRNARAPQKSARSGPAQDVIGGMLCLGCSENHKPAIIAQFLKPSADVPAWFEITAFETPASEHKQAPPISARSSSFE